MKLRIRDHSVRLRLTQPEVAELGRTGRVEAHTRLAPGAAGLLTYALAVRDDVDALTAAWDDQTLTVFLPADDAAVWTTTGVLDGPVGYEATQPIGDETLRLLVEKDFACIDEGERDPAEDAGAYLHPMEAGAGC